MTWWNNPQDVQMRARLRELHQRFHGALQFLRKTTISQQHKPITLDQLPYFLLLGPDQAGKSSFLANAEANYILQRQLSRKDAQGLSSSAHCDWWVTRDACILDVPGHYLTTPSNHPRQKRRSSPTLWHTLLKLIKKHHGKNALSGIIIALPLPEIMQNAHTDTFQATLGNLIHRLQEVQKYFPNATTCHLVITKCDLLPGFIPFFAEASKEETMQSWGISLPPLKANESNRAIFSKQFDALIKKLNQQLIFRLHQERNPINRAFIKDFPLQVEALKKHIDQVIKRLDTLNLTLSIQRIYLTSATQKTEKAKESQTHDTTRSTEQALQVFKSPKVPSRAFFIKHIITHGIATAKITYTENQRGERLKRASLYAASITTITIATVFLGQDFERGIKQAYAIQNELAQYQLAIQQSRDTNESLKITLALLESLKPTITNFDFNSNLATLAHFYTNKAEQKTHLVYKQALQTILLPDIANYIGEHIKMNLSQNGDSVYTLLKAYLSLGDRAVNSSAIIPNTIEGLLPDSFDKNDKLKLMHHLKLALNQQKVVILDANLIEQSRNYLNTTPSLKLALIILKNMDDNNRNTILNLGTISNKHSFQSAQTINRIPTMYTAKSLNKILTHDSVQAAQEAVMGNAVIGDLVTTNTAGDSAAELAEQLRLSYLNNYIDTWENILTNITIAQPTDLAQVDAIIMDLVSNDSPLLQLLQTVQQNTYFDTITSLSPKLQSLGLLLDKTNNTENTLYQLFISLRSVHHYLLPIITSQNQTKSAYDAIAAQFSNSDKQNELAQLDAAAQESPEPLKHWLMELHNQTWHLLSQRASQYLNTAWKQEVLSDYKLNIANQYPFTANTNADSEVDLQKFTQFFGNNGTVIGFYNKYLQPFVDTSNDEWQWKSVNDAKLPFAETTLKQIQQAMRINQTFFPNGDNKLLVEVAIQPYKVDKSIKEIKLNINEKQIIDNKESEHFPHKIAWPNNDSLKDTALQLALANNKTITKHYTGNWGWFKLISQSFENAITRKQALLNFTLDNHHAKYLLFTEGKYNPFLSLNMHNFDLPDQL